MGQLLIRNVDDRVIAKLKAKARERHTSLEQYLREVIAEAAGPTSGEVWEAIDRLRERIGRVRLDATALIREDRDRR